MKAIFFDWDGTLVDSLPLLFASHNHVRTQMGLHPWTQEEYRKAIVYSTRELYPKIYGDKAQAAMDMLYQYITDNHLQQLTLLDGAEELIGYLVERGVPMGVVSNKRHDVLRREVEFVGWQKHFGVYNGAGVAALDKPSGVPLMHALAQHPAGISVKDIIYVGDTESDLSCAKEAGCPVAFIKHGREHADLLSRYQARYVVDNLSELKESLIEFLDRG